MLEGSTIHIRLRDLPATEGAENGNGEGIQGYGGEWLPVRLVAIAEAEGAEKTARAMALGRYLSVKSMFIILRSF
jgi:hypothetical protein